MDTHSACLGISARERYLILRPPKENGRSGRKGGPADNSKNTELFHDRSSLTISRWMSSAASGGREQTECAACADFAPHEYALNVRMRPAHLGERDLLLMGITQ